ncbi:MAG: hypothetical protein CVV02_02900 [Firmicutes bacterium HGW-Firmicutes-7]|nr:MAG: hypothetical protein CVV02_02900 [Firmicutes bacterium HGW-Firmicutes-7]
MNTYIINKVYGIFQKTQDLSEVDGIKLKYVLEMIINDVLKTLIMFVGFSLIGEGLAFLYCCLSLMLIRNFSGGLHLKTFFGCLLFTSSFFGLSVFFNNYITLTLPIFVILFFFNMFIMVLLSPITSRQRPEYSEKKKFHFKSMSIMIVIVHFTFYFVSKHPYFTIAIWVYTLQSIQLLITLGGITYEHKKNIKNAA